MADAAAAVADERAMTERKPGTVSSGGSSSVSGERVEGATERRAEAKREGDAEADRCAREGERRASAGGGVASLRC